MRWALLALSVAACGQPASSPTRTDETTTREPSEDEYPGVHAARADAFERLANLARLTDAELGLASCTNTSSMARVLEWFDLGFESYFTDTNATARGLLMAAEDERLPKDDALVQAATARYIASMQDDFLKQPQAAKSHVISSVTSRSNNECQDIVARNAVKAFDLGQLRGKGAFITLANQVACVKGYEILYKPEVRAQHEADAVRRCADFRATELREVTAGQRQLLESVER
jgi:hypothetical protein